MEKRADVLFVLDASDSMKPCFDKLKESIKNFVAPFQQEGFDSLRLGLLAYNAGAANGKWVYRHSFICGDAPELMQTFYHGSDEEKEEFFTKSGDGVIELEKFCNSLNDIHCSADENTPLALDCAADFPFEPMGVTRRVIILFTDERLETGVLKQSALGEDPEDPQNLVFLEKIMDKIQQRHITLYFFGPECNSTELISEYSRVFVTSVKAAEERLDGESSWDGIDFEKVLEGMGKKISASVVQTLEEPAYVPATFGQDEWSSTAWGGAESGGGVIDITNQKEGIELKDGKNLEKVFATLHWDTPIDLDLHAFYLTNDGEERHVFYGEKKDSKMSLDQDAGVGNKVDHRVGNDETITIKKLEGVQRILFATKIYPKTGCFSDYKGKVVVTTVPPQEQRIEVQMQSECRLDWCVIAMVDNSDPDHARVFAINEVIGHDPDVRDPMWMDGCEALKSRSKKRPLAVFPFFGL